MHARLVEQNGEVSFGIFPDGVERVNYTDFRPFTPMDRPRGALARRFGCNQFHFLGLLGPDLVAGFAVVDLKLVGNGFAYLYRPSTGALKEWSFLQPLARNTHVPDTPNQGISRFSKGKTQISIEANGPSRILRARLDGDHHIEVSLTELDPFKPLSLCTRAGYNGWVYTQKAAGLPVQGRLYWDGHHLDLAECGVRGNYDWSCGFMRRETFWNWACLSTTLSDGRSLGLNLAAGVNETGYTENGFWLDHHFVKVDTVAFEFNRKNPMQPWSMTSSDGLVDLHFQPEGLRKEKIDLWLMASNFKQLFGTYTGMLTTPQGERITLSGDKGFAELHYAKW